MTDLDPAHVEAVADLVGEWLFRMHGIQSSCDHRIEATELLTSTDPAVHAALLASLVRAGVIRHHWRIVRPCGCRAGAPALMCCDSEAPTTTLQQYATDWEDVDA